MSVCAAISAQTRTRKEGGQGGLVRSLFNASGKSQKIPRDAFLGKMMKTKKVKVRVVFPGEWQTRGLLQLR